MKKVVVMGPGPHHNTWIAREVIQGGACTWCGQSKARLFTYRVVDKDGLDAWPQVAEGYCGLDCWRHWQR